MSDTFTSLQKQSENVRTNIRLIEERMSKFVLGTDIPLDLERELQELKKTLAELDARSAILKGMSSPYQGLNPFQAKDAANFFGREAISAELIKDVKGESIVAVVGRSGSGKSSLVLCGLPKQLQAENLLSGDSWRVAICKPGSDPINGLSMALQEHLVPKETSNRQMELARTLTNKLLLPVEKDGLTFTNDVIPTLRRLYPACKVLLLVIDQFEELFTWPSSAATRTRYIDFLLELAATRWVKIVITLRADYYDSLFQYPQMIRVAKQFNVYPMTAEELREAIEKPADAAGRSFEEGLVSRILEDIANSPGDLALLEFTLTRLWEKQTPAGLFTHAAYEAIGQVSGAIAQHADDVLGQIGKDQQGNARRLFQRLVRIQPKSINFETAARVTVSIGDLDTATRLLALDILAANRLVVTGRRETGNAGDAGADGDSPGTVELVHDALIRHWQQLQDWLREDAQWLIIRQELTAQVELWERYGEEDGLLYEGRRLRDSLAVVAERPQEFSQRELRFLKKSREKEYLRPIIVRGGYALALIALGIVGWILWIRPPAVTATPIPMPANSFNVAVAPFAVKGEAGTEEAADLERYASALAEDVAAFFQENNDRLQAQFGPDISLLESTRITLTTDAAGQFLVSAPELAGSVPISSLRANVLIYGHFYKGWGERWELKPDFLLSHSQSTLDWAGEFLGENGLEEPISFLPRNYYSEKERIQKILEARLRTLLVVIRGLDAYDVGTHVGYSTAAEVFCGAVEDDPAEEYGTIEILYLFCGHSLSAQTYNRDISEAEQEAGQEKLIAIYEKGLSVSPNSLRLKVSLASRLITLHQPTEECYEKLPDEWTRLDDLLNSVLDDAERGLYLPLPTRMETLHMLGLLHFWVGRCSTESDIASVEFEQAQSYFASVIELAKEPSLDPSTRGLSIAKANNGQAQMFLTIYEWGLFPEQAIADSAHFFDQALQVLKEMPYDVTAFRYATQIAPSALRVFCLADQKERADFHLQWMIRTSPELSIESLLVDSQLSDAERKECRI